MDEKIKLIRGVFRGTEAEDNKTITDSGYTGLEKDKLSKLVRKFPLLLNFIIPLYKKHHNLMVLMLWYQSLKEQTIFSYVFSSIEKLEALKRHGLIPANKTISNKIDLHLEYLHRLRNGDVTVLDDAERLNPRDTVTDVSYALRTLKDNPDKSKVTYTGTGLIYQGGVITTVDEVSITN